MNLGFISFFLFGYTFYVVHGSGTCNETGVVLCCAGFERLDGGCIECKKGTYSVEGGNCVSCGPNFYGASCALECNCDQTKRCDPVSGCVENTKNEANNNRTNGTRKNKDRKDQTNWMMYLSITVALVSFLIAMTITISKGLRTYLEKKASALSVMSKKEPQQRKTNVYGSYKKVTFKSGDSDDEYEFDSDNCTEDAEDQYASIRESQLVPTVCQYAAGNTYDTNAYTYNHLTRGPMAGGHTVIMATENYAQNVGKPFASFQDN